MVLELLIFDRIYRHIAAGICSNQFGFMKQRSTLQQVLVHFDCIFGLVAQLKQVGVIHLDIKKAFDTVDHNVLLERLWNCGIRGEMWNLIQSYLSHQQQCVSVRGSRSSLLAMTSGVPQGSLVGPLFLILYINDLPAGTLHSSFCCMQMMASAGLCLSLPSLAGGFG
uniref:Reverse transcriptase domain-containing protein n=1 Tax=Amphimedon queenslandica TaxID=400682 RepID=A0A1X7VSN2_AMPQE